MSKHDEKTITNIFPGAILLYDHLTRACDGCVLFDDDIDSYKKLLHTTMIVPDTTEVKLSIPTIKGKISIKETLNSIIAKLVRQNQGYRHQNCLSFGYRQKSSSLAVAMRSNFDVECYFVNTVLPMLSSRVWEFLLNRVGEDILFHILQRPVFVLSKNGCYLQVSGTSSSELIYQLNRHLCNKNSKPSGDLGKRKCSENSVSSPILKRIASLTGDLAAPSSTNSGVPATDGHDDKAYLCKITASTSLPRYRLFYRSNQQQTAGLPTKHILLKVCIG